MTSTPPTLTAFTALLTTTTARATRIEAALSPVLADPSIPLAFPDRSLTRKTLTEAVAFMHEAQRLCSSMGDLLRVNPLSFHGPVAVILMERMRSLGEDLGWLEERLGVQGAGGK